MNSEAANCVIRFETSVDHRSSHGFAYPRVTWEIFQYGGEGIAVYIYIRTEKIWTGLWTVISCRNQFLLSE